MLKSAGRLIDVIIFKFFTARRRAVIRKGNIIVTYIAITMAAGKIRVSLGDKDINTVMKSVHGKCIRKDNTTSSKNLEIAQSQNV